MCLKNISPNNFVVMMHLAEVDVWKFVALSLFFGVHCKVEAAKHLPNCEVAY